MVKTSKCVVVGMKGIGKTTMLEQLIYDNFEQSESETIHPTIEDIYAAVVDTDRGTKETIRFYDTEGFSLADNSSEIAVPKQYHALADGFVLVYAVDNRQSFEMVDLLRKDIERNKEKKEIAMVVLGVGCKSNSKREVDPSFAVSWATREKIRHFEVNIPDRKSLLPPFVYLASKLNPPQVKSGFAPLGMVSRKTKE